MGKTTRMHEAAKKGDVSGIENCARSEALAEDEEGKRPADVALTAESVHAINGVAGDTTELWQDVVKASSRKCSLCL